MAEENDRIKLMKLEGKKTYIVVAVGIAYIVACNMGYLPYSEEVLAGLGLTGLATLRAGVTKSGPVKTGEMPDNADK